MPPLTDSPVLVTGATGFVGSGVVEELLAHGYRVRGTTRDAARARDAGHLTGLPGAERLELVEADLLDEGAFDAAMAGCEFVMHTASPYVLEVKDPQRDLVDPAVNGTLEVLRAAQRAGTVRRVVLTSSFAAVTDRPRPGHVFTEADWNTDSTLHSGSYNFSKTMAERAAWDFVESQQPGFDLVTINPPGVIGPSIVPGLKIRASSFIGLTNGTSPMIIDLDFPHVDVRDVAVAHRLAMERPHASGRYLLCGAVLGHDDFAAVGRELFGDRYPIPKRKLSGPIGRALTRLVALTRPKETRRFARLNIGADYRLDTTKARTELGIEFRDPGETIRDTWLDLERWGLLGKRKRR